MSDVHYIRPGSDSISPRCGPRLTHRLLALLAAFVASTSFAVSSFAQSGASQTAAEQIAESVPQLQPASSQAGASSPTTVAQDAAQQFGEDAAATPPPLSFRPWAEGVTEVNQQAARVLFQEGNLLLRDSLFSQAIKKYHDALQYWDHPAIHYNHALALSTLDQPFKTRDELIASMKYGAGPLGESQFQQAQRYKALVEKQLAYITVECNTPQTVVKLNGKVLFTAPGRFEGFVLPDEYLLTAVKTGYVEERQELTFLPGKPKRVLLQMYTEEELTVYKRPRPVWQPLTVAGGGVVLGVAGVLLMMTANKQFDKFDQMVSSDCPSGCEGSSAELDSMLTVRDKARTLDIVGTTMVLTGGAVLAAGGVLLYINRARPYRVTPEELQENHLDIAFVPVLDPTGAGFIAHGRF